VLGGLEKSDASDAATWGISLCSLHGIQAIESCGRQSGI
jgi:hypothetical protein